MRFGSPHLVNWNEINLVKFLAVHSKVIALFSIMPQLPICSSDIGIRCTKHKRCTAFVNPGCFTLNAPEIALCILDNQIVPLASAIGGKYHIAKLEEPGDNGGL